MIKKPSPIRRFEILGLYGDRDITLDFKHPIKILVDENGAGKTTVLNALFNLLSGNWSKFASLEFSAIHMYFQNNKPIVFDHADFTLISDELLNLPIVMELLDLLSIEQIHSLLQRAARYPYSRFRGGETNSVARMLKMPLQVLYEELRQIAQLPESKIGKRYSNPKFDEKSKKIQELFPHPILYFPTYRRVEEDLHNLGYVEADLNRDRQLIYFGMRDVQHRSDRITSEIRDSSVEWYSKISGQMLTQLIDGIQKESIAFDSIEDPEAFRIVLERIGDNIPQSEKEHILKLIKSGEIKQTKYEPLAYFLSNLIQVYEQQRDKDNAIKRFVHVSNSYLGDKEVQYNESKVDVKIVNNRSGQEISLDKLSSGEKQIISLFSRLYLDSPAPCAIFFDEPELSLSLEWQKKLLQDIVESDQCVLLLAATHSPFIFENDLDQFADVLDIRFLEDKHESC